ncbi:POK9 protein, partial [Smithornis capensis]|nr:POK9 protein [Smithornis capensis]
PGSLGLDLATAIDITFIDKRPVKIPTGVKGPITCKGLQCGALLLGRSSATLNGLTVLPGIIDSDYTGEICIMAQTFFPPMFIPQGTRIAQLVPLQQLVDAAQAKSHDPRNTKGFGSTGTAAFLTLNMLQRPTTTAVLSQGQQQKRLQVLLDPGADITIVD